MQQAHNAPPAPAPIVIWEEGSCPPENHVILPPAQVGANEPERIRSATSPPIDRSIHQGKHSYLLIRDKIVRSKKKSSPLVLYVWEFKIKFSVIHAGQVPRCQLSDLANTAPYSSKDSKSHHPGA